MGIEAIVNSVRQPLDRIRKDVGQSLLSKTGDGLMRPVCILIAMLLSGCATKPNVITTDLTKQAGLYVIGYIGRDDIRREMEDRLVADLANHQMVAYPSHADIDEIKQSKSADLVAAANARNVAVVLIVNRVDRDGSGSISANRERITPENPDLQQYYDTTKDELDIYGNDEAVFAEVNAFFVDGNKTRRFWTGTSWSFNTDNQGGAIAGISETIAGELAKVRDEIRSYSGEP